MNLKELICDLVYGYSHNVPLEQEIHAGDVRCKAESIISDKAFVRRIEGIDVPKRVNYKSLTDMIETPMPYVLEPHREGVWVMPFQMWFLWVEASRAACLTKRTRFGCTCDVWMSS